MNMETEILSGYRSEGVLLMVIKTEYSRWGWKPKTGIERYWDWGKMAYRYRVTLERPVKEPIIERIDNKSEERNAQQMFSYTDPEGYQHMKTFWIDSRTFDNKAEYKKWEKEIREKIKSTL